MYPDDDYMAQYQASSTPGITVQTAPDDVHYEQNSISLTPTQFVPNFNAFNHQQYVAISSEITYPTYTAATYPQQWLPGPVTLPGHSPSHMEVHRSSIHSNQADVQSLTPWSSLPTSNSRSDESTGGVEDDSPVPDDTEDKRRERKERRRAQNRVAQRLFRARREVSLKEHSQRLENLEDEVTRLQADNDDLVDSVKNLQNEVSRLRKENKSLQRRQSGAIGHDIAEEGEDWEAGDDGLNVFLQPTLEQHDAEMSNAREGTTATSHNYEALATSATDTQRSTREMRWSRTGKERGKRSRVQNE